MKIIYAIVISILITSALCGGIFLIGNYTENCDKEQVCYKAVGSSFGSNYLKVDCDSVNADKKEMQCKK